MSDKEQKNQPESGSQPTQPYPPVDPRMLAAMNGMAQEDEIDLLAYWRIIWKHKWFIIGVSMLAGVIATVISLQMPNIYRAEVLLVPVVDDLQSKKQLFSSGALGGLVSLAGGKEAGVNPIDEYMAVLKSREFLWKFVNDEKLLPILFASNWDESKKGWINSDSKGEPTAWDVNRLFLTYGVLDISRDKKTNLVRVAIEWNDRELAANWANTLVTQLNGHLRLLAINQSLENLKYLKEELTRTQVEEMRKVLYELISQEQKKAMVANTQKEFAFRVLDVAMPPDNKVKPQRTKIVIFSVFIVGVFIIVLIVIREKIASSVKQ